MSTIKTRQIRCDGPNCGLSIGGYDLKAYELERAAILAGWSIGSGLRRGVDFCPAHIAPSRRRLTEPAQ